MEAKGEALCPVCGTRHTRSDLTHLAATAHAAIPTQKDVDKAATALKSAEDARASLDSDIRTVEKEIELKQDAVLQDARKLFPDLASFSDFAQPDYLRTQEDAVLAGVREAEAESRAAAEQVKRKNTLQAEQKAKEEQTVALREELDQAGKAENAAGLRVQESQTRVDEKRKTLTFPDKKSAQKEKDKHTHNLEVVKTSLDQHQKDLESANRQVTRTETSLQEKTASLEKTEADLKDAGARLESALAGAGFKSEQDALAALAPIGDEDGEAWLSRQQEEQNHYDANCRNARELVNELTEQLQGKQRPDLDSLSSQRSQTGTELAQATDACAKKKSMLENHTQVFDAVLEAMKNLVATEPAWQRISRLADLADGSLYAEGGRISFDRYVMGAVFRDILKAANLRLDVLSGGRYHLEHRVSVNRSSSKGGLEISVMDMSTGKTRDASSLSGGESFFTSLALALGLSDVVQSHAGGKKLDTLFVDEGFGSLSDDVLDKALSILSQLTEGNRLVGVISHVDRLSESIPQKIRVSSTGHGSTLKLELS